jgi:hypothetical protein
LLALALNFGIKGVSKKKIKIHRGNDEQTTMVSLRYRTQTRFVVLPPARLHAPATFNNIQEDQHRHDRLVSEMQRLRGMVYLRDGAVQKSDLTADGRHRLTVDERSWHVLSLDCQDRVCACLRFLDESEANGFDDLWIRHAALSRLPALGRKFRGAVESGMKQARRLGMSFGEVGGWAVAEAHRGTVEPLRIILATYGLLRLLGGALGVATATFRHGSAPILRRIGLTSLAEGGEELPPYFDPHYGCQMEVLQFDSRRPAAKYENRVSALTRVLATAPVICRERTRSALQGMWRGLQPTPEPALAPVW